MVLSGALVVLILSAFGALAVRYHRRAQIRYDTIDELTGLGNRRWLVDTLDEQLGITTGGLYLMICDVDRFTRLNDNHGLATGDAVLRTVAERLVEALPDTSHIARFGDDEFAIIWHSQELKIAEAVGRLMAAMDRPLVRTDLALAPSISIGIASTEGLDDPSTPELIRRASVALYRAKGGGGGTFAQFVDPNDVDDSPRGEAERELIEAIENDEMTVVYQPIVDRDYRVVAVEALVRWQHPTRGTILPNEFLDTARDTGMIAKLGLRVLREACERLAGWRLETGRDELRVNVNVDALQFDEPGLVDDIFQTLREFGLPGRSLVLEVTEQTLSSMDEVASERLAALQSMGVGISVDDFGAGPSSLSALSEYHGVSEIKIDRAIVGAATDLKGLAIISAVVSMAEVLRFRVVAEGVEHDGEEAAVIALGVTGLQGFRFAKPMHGDAVELERPLLENGQLPWNPRSTTTPTATTPTAMTMA